MVKSNPHLTKLQSNYLFPEVMKRKRAFLEENPHANLISLSIGDTTEPIPKPITDAMLRASQSLSKRESYAGYGPEQGSLDLRLKISEHFYRNKITADEIFISDGAKCDIGRLQMFFGPDVTVALQDPAYPVYLDGSVIAGQTGSFDLKANSYENLYLLPCNEKNNFFPDLASSPKTDLIYFCSPHNPTGYAATYDQLKQLVAFAKENQSIIIFDSAYAFYIQDPNLPRSIYEIPGAEDVAIEVGSFSKMAGFTGVRLGWTIIPQNLKFEEGQSVKALWNRFISTIYNGASNIAEQGGLACFTSEGKKEISKTISYYIENTRILKQAIDQKFETFMDINAPYIFAKCGPRSSWDYFNELLEKAHLITVPGSGFGKQGEHFLRFSCFGSRSDIELAANRLLNL